MRSTILIAFFVIGLDCFSQSAKDSAAIKNQMMIEQLRQRIAAIEDPNGTINDLKNKDRKNQDSIRVLNEMLRQSNEKKLKEKYNSNKSVDAKELNNDLRNNVLALSELGDCHCVRIYYNANQTEVDYSSFKDLDSIVNLLKVNTGLKVKLVGHADKTGTESYNMSLSKERVTRLKSYLVSSKSVPEKRIEIEWHGSAIPFKDSQDDQKQFLNRRAEIFVE
jgi:outer membrane protein OmpA-like peptidoglycan-associated protein